MTARSGPLPEDDALPTYRFRPAVLRDNVAAFQRGFPGTIAYAVKANPDGRIIDILAAEGVTAFDVASISEIRQLRQACPSARLFYMNPVKPPGSIREAYFHHDVRAFSLDAGWELQKILEQTENAGDLELFLRVAVGDQASRVTLSSKFGIPMSDAPALLAEMRGKARKTGICFHVGSQCEDPGAFAAAISDVALFLKRGGFQPDFLDVGGGFPAGYGNPRFELSACFKVIQDALQESGLAGQVELICEPGRALVAGAESLLVKVLGRRQDILFINDGFFGGIFEPSDAFRFPLRLARHSDAPEQEFRVFGPTCDSTDKVEMPFLLPGDVQPGDVIEIGHMGAYSKVMRSGFNGFGDYLSEISEDKIPF